ncbi:unnamed protein product [Adineta ricciae]|uniref:Alpha/beta hydrolase fold-3 domain-containing protein n=1 Tax=Adineta ricciae TaxID=249248 RepID=A0A813PR26_ADIRI|nr:unnamed protein product [Adineta ricciae]CAF1352698.1 unnamed protein product [Adineta ricciae]
MCAMTQDNDKPDLSQRYTSKGKILLIILSLSVLTIALVYQPLPENFPQPWKYRFLSFGAHLFSKLGYLGEQVNLFDRIHVLRFLYYTFVGCFKIRNPEHHLQIYDRKILNVSVRIFEPEELANVDQMPTIIHFHGGGFLLGCRDTYDQVTYALANLTRALVISVEYRRVPEHYFPAAFDDCKLVAYELFQNALKYRIDVNRIALAGDSAGGNLALVITQSLIRDGFNPRTACLIYPALQFFDFTLPSYRLYLPRNILGVINEENFLSVMSELSESKVKVTRDILFNNHTSAEDKRRLRPYVNAGKHLPISLPFDTDAEGNENLVKNLNFLISPKMSPLLVSDEELMQLPPIILFTTEFDILRDEGFILAERLKSLNKTLYHHHFPATFHGAHLLLYGPLKFDIAYEMVEHISRKIRENL